MLRTRATVVLLASTALVASSTPVLAEEEASFDGNTGAPDLRGAIERGEISGSKAEQLRTGSGAWSVGPSGGFQWSLPMEVPPGIQGVQPSLSITYDSHADNGLLGQGFALAGLPAIVRVPGTDEGVADDAEPRGVRFDDHDTFAIAPGGWGTPVSPRGKLVQGTYLGAPASTYHTAIESWEELTPHGNCGSASFSPCVWVAKDGKGNTYYYGATDNGQLWERDAGHDDEGAPVAGRGIVAWALTHYQDILGNTYRVDYHSDGFMLYPTRIEYGCPQVVDPGPLAPPAGPPPPPPTVPAIGLDPAVDPDAPLATSTTIFGSSTPFVGTAQTPPTSGITVTLGEEEDPLAVPCAGGRLIRFQYESRPDLTAMPSRYELRLQEVSMYSGSQAVRRYAFDYEPTPSPRWGRSRLHQVRELGDDFVSQAVPTTFTWSDGEPPDTQNVPVRPWPMDANERVATLSGDIDGDGKDDLVRVSFGADRRRVTWALGQAEELEQGQGPLGPISSPLDAPGSYRHWNATMADVDVDGRDDLVLWILRDGQGEIVVHHGTAGGLGPATPYQDNASLTDFAGQGNHGEESYRLLVADIDGDQVDDLVAVDRHPDSSTRIAYARGSVEGLSGIQTVGGSQLEIPGMPAWLEPAVTDVDGNGIQDVVLTYSRITGVTSQIFRGRPGGLQPAVVLAWNQLIENALCPGSCFQTGPCPCNGVTPFQVLTTDSNGDGIGDLTLAYTGVATPMGQEEPPPAPFGRHVVTWLGQADLIDLPQDEHGRRTDAGKHVLLDTASYPGIDYSIPLSAYWEHHSGDVNGDGFSDLVAFYSGGDGLRAGYAVGTPLGELGPMTTITECAASSTDDDWGAACPSQPDGEADVHRWHSLLIDLDGDGRSDLLRYYAGSQGRAVEIAAGSPSGLGPFEPLLEASPVTEATLPELDHVRSVQLVAPDLNGDGRTDLVLASQAEIVLQPTQPGSPDDVGRPDLLVAVDNGYGATVSVEHEMASRVAGAIDPEATTCGNSSGDECGTPQQRARPLTTRVRQHDGRGEWSGTQYTYANGRYYPGPVVFSSVGSRPHPRADLAFETVEELDENTGRLTRTHYHQDHGLHRLVAQIDVETPFHPPGGGASFPLLAQRETFAYEQESTIFGTWTIQLQEHRTQTFEWTVPATDVVHTYDFHTYGGLARDTECAGERCVETEYVYYPADWSDYIVQRLRERKVRISGSEQVIAWERHGYGGGDLLRTVERLLCDDSEDCGCYDDAALCVSSGRGRWVPLDQEREYDSWGNLTARRDALGHQTRYEYDTTFHTFRTSTEADATSLAGVTTVLRSEATHDEVGRPLTLTDLNGLTTTYDYDPLGRRTEIVHPNGFEEHWDYDDEGSPSSQLVRHRELVDASTGEERWQERYYDGLGRVYALRASAGEEVVLRNWEQTHYDHHRYALSSEPHYESDVGPVLWREEVFDPAGRLVELGRVADAFTAGETYLGTLRRVTHAPGGTQVEDNAAPVSASGQVLGEVWQSTFYETDGRGDVVGIDEPGNVSTTIFRDDARRISMVWGRHASNSLGPIMAETFVEYDYDTLGRTRIVNDSEGWSLLDYDDTGNLTTADDANGEVVTWSYDELGRVLSRTSSAGVESYVYDVWLNGKGHLGEMSGPWGTTQLTSFDEAGNPTTRSVTLAGLAQPQVEAYSYDLRQRMTGRTLPDGTELSYEYDDVGRLRFVRVDGVSYLELDQYDATGMPGVGITPASITSYEYDATHSLEHQLVAPTGGGGDLIDIAYDYDATGNVLGITDQRGNTMVGGIDTNDSWSFTYDGLGQLETASDHTGTVSHYEYDYESNITRLRDVYFDYGAGVVDGHEGSLAGPVVIHEDQDAMGRTIAKQDAKGSWTYARDAHGRVEAIGRDGQPRSEMLYDGSGRRVRKVEHLGEELVTTWSISPNYELRETSADPGMLVATRIVDAPGRGVVATLTDDLLLGAPSATDVLGAWGNAIGDGHVGGAPQGIWFHNHDHIQSTSVVTDPSGQAVARYRNSPWGERTDGSVGFDVAFRELTGQVRDEHVGLVYYGARYYDPATGRFLSPDADGYGRPLYPNGLFDPSLLNRHVYVRNNPVRYTDPTGHSPDQSYTVQPGDTLSGIAEQHLGTTAAWPQLWAANPQVTNPHWIEPGQTLSIPGATGNGSGGSVVPTPAASTSSTTEPLATSTSTATDPGISTPLVPGDETDRLRQELEQVEKGIEEYHHRPTTMVVGPLAILAPSHFAKDIMQFGADTMEVIAGEPPKEITGLPWAIVRVSVGAVVGGGLMFAGAVGVKFAAPIEKYVYHVTASGGETWTRQQYQDAVGRRDQLQQQLGH